jgi:glutamyl-tRNA synthetase
MSELKLRPKTLADLAANAHFFVAQRPIPLDDRAASLLTADARRLLGELLSALDQTDWRSSPLEQRVRDFADEKGIKLGAVAQPLRAALTGSAASPGIFWVMEVLGRDESRERIADVAEAT